MEYEPIYIAHSSDVITDVMNEFRDFMHSDECCSTSLAKSVNILDYFTYASHLDEAQQDRLNSLMLESEMRIQLMSAAETCVLDHDKAVKHALFSLTSTHKVLKDLCKKMSNPDMTYDELIQWIENRKKMR